MSQALRANADSIHLFDNTRGNQFLGADVFRSVYSPYGVCMLGMRYGNSHLNCIHVLHEMVSLFEIST